MGLDLIHHLTRQAAVSRAAFGPGTRTEGVLRHIESEIKEVRVAAEEGDLDELVKEWADIAILGLDGLLRACRADAEESTLEAARITGTAPLLVPRDRVAEHAARAVLAKQGKNELRDWPDRRLMSEDQAIEHDRENGVQ